MVAPRPLRVVFFGTPAFAVPTLAAIVASRHTVVGVVAQPDRPRGRGQRTTDGPVKAAAREAGVPVLQPDRLKTQEFLDALAALRGDIGVVAAYGKILTDAVIATLPLGLINVHASLLPRYRGAAPIHRAVVDGEAETGVTIMRIVRELDAGPMLASGRRAIGPDETSVDVEHGLATLGATLLVETLDRMSAGPVIEEPQDHARATYAHRLTRADGVVDWSRPAAALHNQIRGLQPWPHAVAFLEGERVILLRAQAEPDTAAGAEPGTVLEAHAETLRVATGAGTLRLLSLQREGGRPLSAREFLAGHRLVPGARFTAGA